jgi:hypothetical protein
MFGMPNQVNRLTRYNPLYVVSHIHFLCRLIGCTSLTDCYIKQKCAELRCNGIDTIRYFHSNYQGVAYEGLRYRWQ